VLLRPLPFAEAQRLAWLGGWVDNDEEQGLTPADFVDPSIVTKSVTLHSQNFIVIGVMPPQFQYPPGAELWRPFGFPASPQSAFQSRQLHMHIGTARTIFLAASRRREFIRLSTTAANEVSYLN